MFAKYKHNIIVRRLITVGAVAASRFCRLM